MSKTSKKSSGSSGGGSEKTGTSSSTKPKLPPELIVRPSKVSWQNSAKAYASIDTIRASSLDAGAFVCLDGSHVLAILTPQPIDADVIGISYDLLRAADVLPGHRLRLQKAAKPELATKVVLSSTSGQKIDDTTIGIVRSVGLLHVGQSLGDDLQVVEAVASLEDDIANLSISSASASNFKPFIVGPDTEIVCRNVAAKPSDSFMAIGGLEKEMGLLRTQTELPLRHPDLFSRFNTEPERGVLLYGPPGTGKTMLLKAVAREARDVHILQVNGPSIYSKYLGEAESKLRSLFDEAQRFAPAIIFVDEIDALAPKRDSDDSGETESRVVATLLTLMDGMKPGGRVVLIGATNRPNKLDPALRRPGRLGHEIEIGIPDAIGRRQILDIMLKTMPNHLSPLDVTELADKTHGYVGADLQALVREAVMNVIRKGLKAETEREMMFLERSDLDAAFVASRPSAMREISLETPKVHWSDIGGQESTIQRLRETVEWPLQRASTFERLGITPPRGVLLYGPPGCSKTLLAKALATEAGLNFLAVKGPELFNKYVGESERAIREVFRKARQASPSIVFFDEIDALSVARGEGEAGGDRVLTSLLNEMDGIEALNGVIVLAATNRPDVIDAALMRPGRLDRLVYVGPPNTDARRQILLIQLAKMAVDEDVDVDGLAAATEGFSGAEIVSICQEAGLLAMNEDEDVDYISLRHFEQAITGVHKTITPKMVGFFEAFAGAR